MRSNYSTIKKEISIIEVIKNYLKIEKRGKNYWCVCPFHSDTEPSLSISEEKNIFKCFSCGESGNAISFVMKYEKITFDEAIKKISKQFNLCFSENFYSQKTDLENKKREKLFLLNSLISSLYHNYLLNNAEKHLNYLIKERKIPMEIIEKFELGFCPENNIIEGVIEKWNELNPEKKFNFFELQESGHLIKNKEEKNILFFSNRITFPLKNEKNQIVGFAARRVLPTEKIKYLNSGENFCFKKSINLFNIQNIEKNKNIYLFEGYVDLISAFRVGIKNSVALMGISLSDVQIEILKNYSKKINFCLDNDDAGQSHTFKFAKKLILCGFEVNAVDFLKTSYKDIDEFILKEEELASDVLKKPINFFDWFKNFLLLKKQNLSIDEIKSFIGNFLSWFFYLNNSELFVIPEVSMEYASLSIPKIFELYKLSTQTIDSESIHNEEKKYLELISKQVAISSLNAEKPLKKTTKATTIKLNSEKQKIMKLFPIFFEWKNKKETILENFPEENWSFDLKNTAFTFSGDTKEFLNLFVNFFYSKDEAETENIFKSEQLNIYKNYWKNYQVNPGEINTFFEIYFSLISFFLNEELKSLKSSLLFNFQEKLDKKSKIEQLIQQQNLISSDVFKKLLLFRKK